MVFVSVWAPGSADMATSKSLDYRSERLRKGGKVIDWFRVAGFLAEHGLQASLRVGNTVLAARHLPRTVEMRLDGLGVRQVCTFEEERSLAARTAKVVRSELHRLGLEVRAVVRRVMGGRVGEEHDMVLEVTDNGDAGPVKKISGELKMRRLWSNAGLNKARKEIQKEAVDECQWWQTEAQTGKWAGRLVVLAH